MMSLMEPVGVRVAEGFAVFYAREFTSVVATGYALTGSWPIVEDLTQDAFMAAHRSWAKTVLGKCSNCRRRQTAVRPL
jgi:DNA-directed RNA polymerase specialized sigma24 family protein